MKNYLFLLLSLCLTTALLAQNKDDKKNEKKTVKEVIDELPDMLIAQPDNGADTLADKLVNFNLQLTVPPVWKTNGALIFSDFKVQKADHEPVVNTLPFPDKKIAQGIWINMNTVKKPVTDKKDAVIKELKSHLTALYKENGESISASDLDAKVKTLISEPEAFVTNEGKKGELYLINDIQGQQVSYIILLLIPGADGKSSHFVDFRYFRYNYESNLPEDLLEWLMFVYPDEQQAYIDFTKKISKTLVVR